MHRRLVARTKILNINTLPAVMASLMVKNVVFQIFDKKFVVTVANIVHACCWIEINFSFHCIIACNKIVASYVLCHFLDMVLCLQYFLISWRKNDSEKWSFCLSYLWRHDHRSQCYCLCCFYYGYVNVHDTSNFCTYVNCWCCTWLYIILYWNLFISFKWRIWYYALAYSYKLMKFQVDSKVDGIVLFMRVRYKEALHF
jgi:hypothetical protein